MSSSTRSTGVRASASSATAPGPGDGGRGEAGRAVDVGAVGLRGDGLVLDDQHPDHAVPRRPAHGRPPAAPAARRRTGRPGPASTLIDAAVAADRLRHQRQPEPPARPGRRRVPSPLGRPARGRTAAAAPRRHARAAVLHPQLQPLVLDPGGELHLPGRLTGERGVDGVVEQVADDGDELAARDAGGRRRRCPGSISSRTPRSCAVADLPSSSAASTGASTASTTRSVSCWADASSAVAKSTASCPRPSSMQRHRRVQAVAGLVRLGPQRLGEGAHAGPAHRSAPAARCGRAASPRRRPSCRTCSAGAWFTTSTRPPLTCTSSTVCCCAEQRLGRGPATAPARRRGGPSGRRSRASSRRASSLTSCTRRSPSTSSRPSRTACSTAW